MDASFRQHAIFNIVRDLISCGIFTDLVNAQRKQLNVEHINEAVIAAAAHDVAKIARGVVDELEKTT